MKKILYQHGDLLLEKLPNENEKQLKIGLPRKDAKRTIILKGEGVNTHDVVGDFMVYDKDGTLYLSVKDAVLEHSEHGTINLAPGLYRRIIEREWIYNTSTTSKPEHVPKISHISAALAPNVNRALFRDVRD